MAACDLVIEAATENEELKKQMMKQGLLDQYGKPNDKTPPNYLSQTYQDLRLVFIKNYKKQNFLFSV